MTVNELRESLKTVIYELDLLKEAVIIQWIIWKKDLLFFATKLIERIVDLSDTKEYYNSFLKRKKCKFGKTIKNNYLATKSYRKLKQFWNTIIYYRISKNLNYPTL